MKKDIKIVKKPYHQDKDHNNNRSYKPYKPVKRRFRKRRFQKYKNTPENRKRFRFKRKFRRKKYIKPLQGNESNIKDCKCWNCNEKGH